MERFDDKPQWYFAVADTHHSEEYKGAGVRFVVACGQRDLWDRVESFGYHKRAWRWQALGTKDGSVSLENCLDLLISDCENHSVDHDTALMELARVPAFAGYLHRAQREYVELVNNPRNPEGQNLPPYNRQAAAALQARVEATLGIEDTDE